MTDQIDMIYLKIFLYFGLYQNHLRRIKLFIYSKTIVKLKEKQSLKMFNLKLSVINLSKLI